MGREQHNQLSGKSVSCIQLWLHPGKCSEPQLHLSHFLGSLGAKWVDPLPAAHCRAPLAGQQGTRSGRGRQGQVMGARGEELFAMPGGVFT